MRIDNVKVDPPRAVFSWRHILAAVVVVVVASVGYFVVIARIADINQTDARNACSDRLIGYAFDAAARTLSAPPAPNPARVATAKDFVAAAHRLSDADRVCAATNNKPAPLPPSR